MVEDQRLLVLACAFVHLVVACISEVDLSPVEISKFDSVLFANLSPVSPGVKRIYDVARIVSL